MPKLLIEMDCGEKYCEGCRRLNKLCAYCAEFEWHFCEAGREWQYQQGKKFERCLKCLAAEQAAKEGAGDANKKA